MGTAIPGATYATTTTASPEFQFYVDPPGDLSVNGPRHDNDHASIERICILPTTSELKAVRPEFLPMKYKESPHHETGIQRLLDSQFRLLREDTSGQLRDAVCGLVTHWDQLVRGSDKNLKRKIHRQINARLSLFTHAKVKRLNCDRRVGLTAKVTFAQPVNMSKMREQQRIAWWEESKDLQKGSIVAIVDNTLETLFLLVTERTVYQKVGVDSAHEPDEDLVGTDQNATITLALIDPTSKIDQARLMTLAAPSKDSSAVLVEFPGLLFASFEPVLKVLQSLHRQPHMPFADWLAPGPETRTEIRDGFVTVPPPLYLSRNNVFLDLTCITQDGFRLRHSLKQPVTIEELEAHTTLDRGQCQGLINSLRHELALVQGPPGTGKSYVGDKIVQILLANKHRLRIGPIICVCYTNHALDQFLEHVLNHKSVVKPKVIRMGSSSKSVVLSELTLAKVRFGTRNTMTESCSIRKHNKELDEIRMRMQPVLQWSSTGCTVSAVADRLLDYDPAFHDCLFAGAKGVYSVDAEGYQLVANHTTKQDLYDRWIQGMGRPWERQNQPTQARSNRSCDDLLKCPQQVWKMSVVERRKLWAHWVETIVNAKRHELQSCMEDFTETSRMLQIQYKERDKRCLEKADIIGVTTTGLAMNAELIRRLPVKVLVCEEAAEVLEAHILTALIPSVEHAILIGDHLQLRATISNNSLSMENPHGQKYGLDESLFERLAEERFDGAKFPIAQLGVQRRMHPSIAELVRETLYPDLQDHVVTLNYPEVWGMRRRLFWLDHRNREDSGGKDGSMQTSKTNEWEAKMVVSLVKHLARQCSYHRKEDIAVLTPYLGQLRILRKKFSETFDLVIGEKDMQEIETQERDEMRTGKMENPWQGNEIRKGKLAEAIRIATVDNFQGEEAKIIVISLVRSNEKHECGFLKTSNRINVLLSRAQHGMYIIGDSETARPVEMWGKVINMLQEKENIGPALALQCPRHPKTDIHVEKPEDFTRLAPEGGCSERCGKRLKCGHSCNVKCHAQALHEAVECYEDCIRQYTHCSHSCPKRCYQRCGNCMASVTNNKSLPCGHTPTSLFCYQIIDLVSVPCMQTVNRTLKCGHTVTVACHRDPAALACPSKCGSLLPCGHRCGRNCFTCRKMNLENKEEVIEDHQTCIVQCGRSYTTCHHDCSRKCHPGTPCGPCGRPCEVACTHARCSNKCSEPCPPCAESCTWSCKHRGKCHMPCAVPCDIIPCSVRCDKPLECGHQCPSICGEDCPSPQYCRQCAGIDILDRVLDLIELTTYREADLDSDPVIFLNCGHFYSVGTLDGHMDLRSAYEIDEQGEILEPKNFSRTEIEACPECRAPLRNIHRYNRVVKGALLDEATKRFMAHAGTLQARLIADVAQWEAKLEQMANQFRKQGKALNTAYTSKEKGIMDYKDCAAQATNCVAAFLAIVAKTEQPYGRVQSMVLNARRRQNAVSKFELDNSVIQYGFELRGKAQSLRVLWANLWNFQRMIKRFDPELAKGHRKHWRNEKLEKAKNLSIALILDAEKASMVREEIEAYIYHAKFVALELYDAPEATELPLEQRSTIRDVELHHLDQCLLRIDQHASAEHLRADVVAAQHLLNGWTFYSFVISEEKKTIYAAMAREFGGTGHWYYCQLGHPFSVGECGMRMELVRCPECGSPVGGQNHQATTGVTHARNLDTEFGQMTI